MEIGQQGEPGYEQARIGTMGFVDPHGMEGVVVLRSDSGAEFPMRAFSGEVIHHISGFGEGDPPPSIYRLVGEICEECEVVLVKVKIYESGGVMRANLYLTGKKDIILRNYRASDAVALASFYRAPILVREGLLARGADAPPGGA
ncbi:MAG: DUF151 domain-containing protein [Nitrosopumilus sp.]|nr:DUF151 domain-containing protein [Nitrosopumilus sp.]MDA7957463.1 DUF151 domain-containing protein [Nitrosopumilus sp.]